MRAYDEVPYEGQPIPCTAPEQLAATSLLHGGPRPEIRGARVLEIGCGDGANLLPLAFHRPDCHFVGVDASRLQVEDARASAARLGLANIELHAADVTRIGDRLGSFDYVVAHGVMSWVSDAVRDGILALCREKLAPDGLLYLGYNTNPGWLARGLVRELMLGGARAGTGLRERAREAVVRADALRAPLEEADHPYARLLVQELARVHRVGESYLIHDYLSEHNRAYWFRDFASLLAGFGFDYLAEAAFTTPDYRVPPELAGCAASLAEDRLEAEALVDVLWYRQHRASLFCRAGCASPERARALAPDGFTIASGLRAISEREFVGCLEPDLRLEIDDAPTRAALAALASRWPRGLSWGRLCEEALPAPGSAGRDALWTAVRELHALGQLELRLVDLPERGEPSDPPVATPLARWEAERRDVVTTATHERLTLGASGREVVRRLDGSAAPGSPGDAERCIALLGSWGLLL